jgi:hypothetical protein
MRQILLAVASDHDHIECESMILSFVGGEGESQKLRSMQYVLRARIHQYNPHVMLHMTQNS